MQPSTGLQLSKLRANRAVSGAHALLIGLQGPVVINTRDGRQVQQAILSLTDSVHAADDWELTIWGAQSLFCAALKVGDIVELQRVRIKEGRKMAFAADSSVRKVFEQEGIEVGRLKDIKSIRLGAMKNLTIRGREWVNPARNKDDEINSIPKEEGHAETKLARIAWLRGRRETDDQTLSKVEALAQALRFGIRVRCSRSYFPQLCDWREPNVEKSCNCNTGYQWRFGNLYLGVVIDKEVTGRISSCAIQRITGYKADEVWKNPETALWVSTILAMIVGETFQIEVSKLQGVSGVELEVLQVFSG
ncbi:hypothetical protein BWQ96_06437 [Gracilariopsis chorda]|uniref:Uncharacterized protein n=1 Tax=Gracilariopsis chorda TaxID=448386 RepID=A0A2V3IP01_9FLOR|nr:hypothetical protein BWQ96_06437 [Gracilariopsis chorda]|eukprot:PXF43816.1 hypothetical protein BWQ96_06437 [Gracilariopsis chorda]